MKCSEEIRQQLWELIYDLLPDDEAEQLCQRISSDPVVARAYSEARLRAELLATAARHEEARVRLAAPQDESEAGSDRAEDVTQPVAAASFSTARVVSFLASIAALLLVMLTGFGYVQYGSRWAVAAIKAERDDLELRRVQTIAACPQVLDPSVTPYVTFYTYTPDGMPVSTTVNCRVVADGEVVLQQSQKTDDNGFSRLELPNGAVENDVKLRVEPRGDVAVDLYAKAADHKDAPSESFKWYVAREVDSAEPEVEVLAAKSRNLIVAAENYGRQVGQQAVTPPPDDSLDRMTRFNLPLAPETSGPTRVKVYDFASSPPRSLDEQLFFFAPAKNKKLSIAPVDTVDVFSPGDKVQLQFQVSAGGQPVPEASLRVAVVEETVLQTYSHVSGVANNQLDVLSAKSDHLEGAPEPADDLLVVSDLSLRTLPPLVSDNTSAVHASFERALAQILQQREARLRSFGSVIVGAAAILLLGLVVLAAMRLTKGARVVVPTLVAAVGCLLIGTLWMTARIDQQGTLAFGSLSAARFRDDATRAVATNDLKQLPAQTATEPAMAPNGRPLAKDNWPEGVGDRTGGGGGGGMGVGGPGGIRGYGGGLGGGPGFAEQTASPRQGSFHSAPGPSTSTTHMESDDRLQSLETLALGLVDGKERPAAVPTFYENSQLTTSEDGRATVTFELPPAPGTYRVFVEGRAGKQLGLYRGKIIAREAK